jgi:hypothetical protein
MTQPIQNPVVQGPKAIIEGYSGNLADVDSTGALKVNVTSGGGGSNASVSATGAAVPASATLVGGSESGTLQPVSLDGTGNLNVNVAASVAPAGVATSAKQDTGNASLASIDTKTPALSSGRVPVDGSGVTQPVSVSGAVNASAAVWNSSTVLNTAVNLTASGDSPAFVTVQITASGTPNGAITFEYTTDGGVSWTASNTSDVLIPSSSFFSSSNPIGTAGTATYQIRNVGFGQLRARLSTVTTQGTITISLVEVVPLVASLAGAYVTNSGGTVTGFRPLLSTPNGFIRESLDQIAGNAILTGTGVSGTGAPRVTVSNDSQVRIWDGTTQAAVVAGTTALKGDLSSVASQACATAAAGIQKVGIVGSAAAVFDAVITAATAPANALATLSVCQTTAPSLTAGQSVAVQSDYQGSVFVKPYRRGQTKGQATTITNSSAAATCVTAQAANIFADISTLMLTVTPAATTDIAFTASLSDGTNTYVFDMDTGALATATATPTVISVSFDPPLPATTAATAWTLTLSVNTVTVHCTIVFVLQKAS